MLAAGVTSFLVEHVKVPREKVKLEDPVEKPEPFRAIAKPPPPNVKTVPDPTPEPTPPPQPKPAPVSQPAPRPTPTATYVPQRSQPAIQLDEFFQPTY